MYFLDIEADGFMLDATKIHCLAYKPLDGEPVAIPGDAVQDHLDSFFNIGDTHVWHNGWGYDIPTMQKLGLRYRVHDYNIIDTLALSREWWPDCPRGHGLDAWAKVLGMKKPKIENWIDGDIEDYMERCKEDAKTTEGVYKYLLEKL